MDEGHVNALYPHGSTFNAHSDERPALTLPMTNEQSFKDDTCDNNDKKGFNKLALEPRNIIYSILLGDDYGCTEVLMLNKQIYSEAISILRELDHDIRMNMGVKSPNLFRNPFPKDKQVFSEVPTAMHRASGGDGVTELDFISLRRITLVIDPTDLYETPSAWEQLTAALPKSTQIQQITLMVSSTHLKLENTEETALQTIRDWLELLIKTCISKCIVLTATDTGLPYCGRRRGSNRRVRGQAHHRTTSTRLANQHTHPVMSLIQSHSSLQIANQKLLKPLTSQTPTTAKQTSEPDASREPLQRTRTAYVGPQGGDDFRLQPECRQCYIVFASRASLEQHLQQKPHHAVPFVREQEAEEQKDKNVDESAKSEAEDTRARARARAINAEIERNILQHISDSIAGLRWPISRTQ